MNKERLEAVALIGGGIIIMILLMAGGVMLARNFAFVDGCLEWAADRQIPTWIGAFGLFYIVSTLGDIGVQLRQIDRSVRVPRE